VLNLVKISEIFNIEKGILQSSKNTPGEYDFITASAEWKTNETYSHKCEALIFAMGASGSLGRTHYVNGKFITSDLCFIITPKLHLINDIDLKFYYYYFNLIRPKLVKETATGTSKLAINQTNFLNYKVIFGKLDEQIQLRSIYEYIDEYSKELLIKIGKQEKYLTRLRQTILKMAVEGKLTSKSEDDESASVLLEKIYQNRKANIKYEKMKKDKPTFTIPTNWVFVELGELLKDLRYGTSKKCEYAKFSTPVLRIPNIDIVHGIVDVDDLKYTNMDKSEAEQYALQEDDILFIRSNGSETIVGRSAIVDCSLKGYAFAGYLVRARFTENIYVKFIWYQLSSQFVREQIERPIRTTSGVKNINSKEICNIQLALPPFAEQHRIVEKVDRLMTICDELERSIETSKQNITFLMQAVLHQAFIGKDNGKIVEFPQFGKNDYVEEWDIAARETGDIKPETANKIAALLATVGTKPK
jgi:type I restriction enzyme S subunit